MIAMISSLIEIYQKQKYSTSCVGLVQLKLRNDRIVFVLFEDNLKERI